MTFDRVWRLEGVDVIRRSQGDGSGRVIEAYATVFDSPAEIRDASGHYIETIARTAFDGWLASGRRPVVLWNHGMSANGLDPDALASVPIGKPLEIRADGRGLLTRTRLNTSPLAEHVLAAVRSGDVAGYSFRGPIRRSNPRRPAGGYRPGPDGRPPRVVRLELGLVEYGPVLSPAYLGAKVLGVRSDDSRRLDRELAMARVRTQVARVERQARAHDLDARLTRILREAS